MVRAELGDIEIAGPLQMRNGRLVFTHSVVSVADRSQDLRLHERQVGELPLVQAEILRTIGNAYYGVGEYKSAVAHLERSRDLYVAQFGPNHPNTLTALLHLAYAYELAGKVSEAIHLLEQVSDQRLE